MKKLILILAVLYFCCDGVIAKTVCNSSASPNVIITLNINFHSRKSNCQSGFGICSISINIDWDKPTNGNGMKVQAFINPSNQLVLRIPNAGLQAYENGSTLNYFAGKKTIVVDDSYELSREVNNALGSTSPLVIKKGEYPVTSNGTYYEIIIPQ